MSESDKIILIGIDEAGYGPILGPLVASATAFAVPACHAEDCMWDTLKGSIGRTASGRDSRLPVLDSKKLYHRKEGIGRLERSVLAATMAWRGLPPRFRTLMGMICPDLLNQMGAYPWYREADPILPCKADHGSVRIAGTRLGRDLERQGIGIAGFWSEVLLEGHYNRMVGQIRNKAVVLFGLILRLIHRAAESFPDHELRIFVDRQGARAHYAPQLMRAFEPRSLRIISETAELSVYELLVGPNKWSVSFVQSGESNHMPIALASLFSKYIREVLMHCFNDFWTTHSPDLKPTAGYYTDGLRFLQEIQPHVNRLGIERTQLVRQR